MNKIGRLLAIFAHPDDESYRAGGALALLAREGAQVWVLCATRGEQGILDLDPEETGQLRQTEMECACRALGIEKPCFLEHQDGTPFFAYILPIGRDGLDQLTDRHRLQPDGPCSTERGTRRRQI